MTVITFCWLLMPPRGRLGYQASCSCYKDVTFCSNELEGSSLTLKRAVSLFLRVFAGLTISSGTNRERETRPMCSHKPVMCINPQMSEKSSASYTFQSGAFSFSQDDNKPIFTRLPAALMIPPACSFKIRASFNLCLFVSLCIMKSAI